MVHGDEFGDEVGDPDGDLVGDEVGDPDGDLDGDEVGDPDGDLVGDNDFVGDPDGDLVGVEVGDPDGDLVGDEVGEPVVRYLSHFGFGNLNVGFRSLHEIILVVILKSMTQMGLLVSLSKIVECDFVK